MSLAIALEILELALSLVKGPAANKAAVLAQIVGKALQAYKDQTGAPLDLSLIKPE
jgi:hypothetical protein